jgi:hypothetical protein
MTAVAGAGQTMARVTQHCELYSILHEIPPRASLSGLSYFRFFLSDLPELLTISYERAFHPSSFVGEERWRSNRSMLWLFFFVCGFYLAIIRGRRERRGGHVRWGPLSAVQAASPQKARSRMWRRKIPPVQSNCFPSRRDLISFTRVASGSAEKRRRHSPHSGQGPQSCRRCPRHGQKGIGRDLADPLSWASATVLYSNSGLGLALSDGLIK